MSKLAVVLFNLGGPDRPESVKPFLFNLFNDPAIIGAPRPIRWLLARLISSRRAPVARAIYARIGGKSPLLEMTGEQATALERLLGTAGEAKVFVAMRYWHPMSDEVAVAVRAFAPDEIVLLPLYPQYSTTTSGSSLGDWRRAAAAAGIGAPTVAVCCYPGQPGLIEAQAALVRAAIGQAAPSGTPRVLFSAHGLPQRIVARGDPYVWQVNRTAEAVVAAMDEPGLDWVVCYQSKIGPLAWTGPALDEELARAARDRVPVVVNPVAFVSEHSETLVELDIEYRAMAEKLGVPAYVRVPAVGTADEFVGGLAAVVEAAREQKTGLCSGTGGRLCPAQFGRCPNG
ncbi:MAG: ferrochelatase [Alphaproteobacteria bacterium]|nr:ferrochelatase [Alphaproteobacteria bacterium]